MTTLKKTACVQVPFLKWAGGKRWLSPLLSKVLVAELKGIYFEPFLGAGSVFLELKPKYSKLSDINEDLIHFLTVVRIYPEEVVRAVWRWTNTAECYSKVRNSVPRSDIERAARFLFLNRTCWGGIYRTNRNGQFNVPFGNSGRKLCSLHHVVEVSSIFTNAELIAQDFIISIREAQKGDVIYADPPYTVKGENNGFIRYNEKLFSWNDQEKLAHECEAAKQRGAFVAVSGLYHKDLLSLYNSWWALKMSRQTSVSRDVSSRRKVSEVVFFSKKPKSLPIELEKQLKYI